MEEQALRHNNAVLFSAVIMNETGPFLHSDQRKRYLVMAMDISLSGQKPTSSSTTRQ
jgi:hypothetical protein